MKTSIALCLMTLSLILGYALNSIIHAAQYEQISQELSLKQAAQNIARSHQLAENSLAQQNLNSRLGILASCIQGENFIAADARTVNCQTFTTLLAQGKVTF